MADIIEYPNFVGASYTLASPSIDCERSLNLYTEIENAPGALAKSKSVLKRRPGLALLQTLGDSPGRGVFALDGRAFAVAGGSFYELLTSTTAVKRGSLASSGTSPVLWSANTTQIAVVADGLLYIFVLSTNAFSAVTGTAGLPGYITSITSIDTYFLAIGQGTTKFSISSPLDGTQWSGLDFGSSQEPDNAVAIANLHLYLWIFGQTETVLFQDSGGASFPFARVPGTQIEMGCAAPGSVKVLDNTLFWLGSDKDGGAIVYRADGLLPTRVSTHAVEAAIQGYGDVSDAVASTYQHSGHLFYCLHFPSANSGAGATWVWDAASNQWHERAYWNASAGTYSADLARFHAFCFNTHLALDYTSGNLYELSAAYATDAGAPLRWLRAAPHLARKTDWLRYASFEVDMEVGGGLPAGADPQIMVRWSDDGGFTWSSYRQASTGTVGAYLRRVIVRRCGRARSRVFEISSSDPIPRVALLNAYLGVE